MMDERTDRKLSADASEDGAVGELLHLVGRRRDMPGEAFTELKQVAHAVWQDKVRARTARRQRSRRRSLALAAGVILTVGAGWWLSRRDGAPVPPPAVATVTAQSGVVSLSAEGSTFGAAAVELGSTVPAGAALRTEASGHVALRLAGGTEVRLDHDTRLKLPAAAVLSLSRGAVYLDSGRGGSEPVEVHTPFGIARDVGTQFEVRLDPDGLRVQVREGEVRLDRDGDVRTAPAGTVLSVGADGTVTRGEAARHGPSWDWIFSAGSAFALEGGTVGGFLDWLARETGWQVRWVDSELEREIRGETTHGSIEGLRPEETLELVLPSAGLRFELDGGVLVITQPTPHSPPEEGIH